MRVIVKLYVDDKEILLSDRDYANQPLNWKIIEESKVDAMQTLNKIMPIEVGTE